MDSIKQNCPGGIRANAHKAFAFHLGAMVLGLIALSLGVTQSAPQSVSKTAPKESRSELIPVTSRSAPPDFSLSDLDGKPLSLGQYRGKVVLLDFWAVDCGGCIIEIPWYVEFDKMYRDRGLVIIGIDMYNEAPDYVRPFMAKSHMQYRVAIGNDGIGKQFQADELPKTLLIDRQGRVAVSHVGIVDKTSFEQDIRALLQ